MPTNPDPDWGTKALAEMDAAEAELDRVHVEVQAVPAMIENANARLERCLREDRRLDREREEAQVKGASHVV